MVDRIGAALYLWSFQHSPSLGSCGGPGPNCFRIPHIAGNEGGCCAHGSDDDARRCRQAAGALSRATRLLFCLANSGAVIAAGHSPACFLRWLFLSISRSARSRSCWPQFSFRNEPPAGQTTPSTSPAWLCCLRGLVLILYGSDHVNHAWASLLRHRLALLRASSGRHSQGTGRAD